MRELTLGVLVAAFGVFATSAAAKLRGRRAYTAFRTELGGTNLVPPSRVPAVALILVAAEAATTAVLGTAAALTATGRADAASVSTVAVSGATVLAGTLAVGVAVLIRRGTPARCACFGAASARPIGVPHLVRNSCLLVLLLAGLAALQAGPGHASPGALVAAAVGGMLTAVLLVRFDDVVEVFLPVQPGGGR